MLSWPWRNRNQCLPIFQPVEALSIPLVSRKSDQYLSFECFIVSLFDLLLIDYVSLVAAGCFQSFLNLTFYLQSLHMISEYILFPFPIFIPHI